MRGGTSVQHVMFNLVNLVHANPESWVVRLDAESCFETIEPEAACRALEHLGVPSALLDWLRRFYEFHDGQFAGLGRGVAFAPIIALAYLLSVYKKLRELGTRCLNRRRLRSDHQGRAVGPRDRGSREVGVRQVGPEDQPESREVLRGPGVRHLVVRRTPVRPRARAPEAGAADRLVNKLHDTFVDPEKADYLVDALNGVQAGWVGQYAPAAFSPEVIRLGHQLQLGRLPGVRCFTSLSIMTHARMHSSCVPQKDPVQKVSGMTNCPSSSSCSPSSSRFLSPVPSPPGGAQAASSSPYRWASSYMAQGTRGQSRVPWALPDPLDLLYHPERCAPLDPVNWCA